MLEQLRDHQRLINGLELTRFGGHLHVGHSARGRGPDGPSEPPEFREQAVGLVRATDKTVAAAARDLGINDTTLGNWVKADRAERGVPDATGLCR